MSENFNSVINNQGSQQGIGIDGRCEQKLLSSF